MSGKVWMASFLSPLHSASWVSKLPIFLSKSWKSIFLLCEKWYCFALCSILPCAKQLPDLFFFCSNNASQYGHPIHMHGRQNLDRSLVLWTKHCNVTSFATNIAKLNNYLDFIKSTDQQSHPVSSSWLIHQVKYKVRPPSGISGTKTSSEILKTVDVEWWNCKWLYQQLRRAQW